MSDLQPEVESVSTYQRPLDSDESALHLAIWANIDNAIVRARQDGITSMSLDNLRQITSSRNIPFCRPLQYRCAFEHVAKKYFRGFIQ